MFNKNLTFATVILLVVLIMYGLRLGIYLFIREHKSNSFRNKINNERKNSSDMSFSGKCSTWIGCASIYACEVSPLFFRLSNGTPDNMMAYLGMIIAILGFLFESIGDQQKFNAKKKNPTSFVSSGLYKYVRCPNYLGEILVWTGVFLSGITSYKNIWQWTISLFGYLCILSVMLSAVRSLEGRQNKAYGNDKKYQEYIKKTPIIIPFVPIYTFGAKVKV
ncbi:DUF1295-domain-containing protein [Neocallimastix sp. 'constans']